MGRKSRAKWEKRRQEALEAAREEPPEAPPAPKISPEFPKRLVRDESVGGMKALTAGEMRHELEKELDYLEKELDDDAMFRVALPPEPGGLVNRYNDRAIIQVRVVSDRLAELHCDFPEPWPIGEDSKLGMELIRKAEEAGEPPPELDGSIYYGPDEDELTAGEVSYKLRSLDDDAEVRVLLPPDLGDPVDPDEHWVPVRVEVHNESLGYLYCDFPRPYSSA